MAKKKKALVDDDPFVNGIEAKPVKSFFVEMLTRDIALDDAILDLLDNCVDGILRSTSNRKRKFPYKGFWARINFDKNKFEIKDNCGGIPWNLHKYAFRMGRAKRSIDKGLRTVGVYGIGMKRAIFKMGMDGEITTKNKSDSYMVSITKSWMKSEKWRLPVVEKKGITVDGTKIKITSLHAGISKQLGKENFLDDLRDTISTNYAFIIEKGFKIIVNGEEIEPKSITLKFARNAGNKKVAAIAPFIYKTKCDGVEVFLAVGFTGPLVGEDDIDQENYKSRFSAEDAGWSIICNDRVVVHRDKTQLTGWGSAGVPRFHNQFIAISGIVEFSSEDPAKLPTTTTKRGIEASSTLFLHVRDKMIEGMKHFTGYTNKWKGKYLEQSRKEIESLPALPLDKIKEKVESIKMTSTKPISSTSIRGRQFKPNLPEPQKKKKTSIERLISFKRKRKEVELVSEYIYGEKNISPKKVGNKCFEIILDNARG